ncbi:MAG: lysophospholipase [Erysipelotrichia bacterium]|nr:lysophospholipase [Erysipelotrichia bacterium]
MEYYMIGILLILIPIVGYYAHKYGKKAGVDWLLSLLFKSGFDAKVAGFKKQNAFIKKGGIVFVGDSITQDYNVYEYFHQYHVYNRGIGGDTTEGLLKRLDESIFELEPKTVILLMGTNDFGVLNAYPNDIYMRMKSIIEAIQKRLSETKIILISVYPVNPKLDPTSVGSRNNENIKKLNKLYETIPGIQFVNLFDQLKDEEGNLKKEYSVEGLHINQNGYEVITNELKKYL